MGRARYSFTPATLIDLIAILPFYLPFLLSIDLRFQRVVRLLRIFKLTRYSAAIQVLLDVLKNKQALLLPHFILLA